MNEGWVRPTGREAALAGLPEPPSKDGRCSERMVFPLCLAWPGAKGSGLPPQIGEGGKKGQVDLPVWGAVSTG